MKKQTKKLIAPILITLSCLGVFSGWALLLPLLALAGVALPLWLRLAVGGVLLALAGVSVYVLVERMKEIQSGEEDDLSKY